MRGAHALALCTLACAPEADPDRVCGPVAIAALDPSPGSTTAAQDAAITLTLDAPAGGTEVWVDGGVTDGWVALDGAGPTWEVPAAAPLSPDATHTLSVRRCGVIHDQASFSTRPGPQAQHSLGRAFVFDFWSTDLTWTEPPVPPPEAMLQVLLGDTRGLLVAPLAADGGAMSVGWALAEDRSGRLRQDACNPTTTSVAGDVSADPAVTWAAESLALGDGTSLFDVALSGVLTPQAEGLEGARLTGALDARGLASSGLDLCGPAGEVLEASCVACPDQQPADPPACLLLDATAPTLDADPDLTFTASPTPHAGCR